MNPARNVGGDFFDVVRLENGCIGVSVADVSDKGVPAALFMMSSRTLLKGASIGSTGPGEVLREVNDLLNEDNEASMFVTIFYAEFDPESGEFIYANGGHNPPLYVRADGSSTLLPLTGGVALGSWPTWTTSRIPSTWRTEKALCSIRMELQKP
jgi:sigma-B regulation protein RsbU (phosphoserine phosphatase)